MSLFDRVKMAASGVKQAVADSGTEYWYRKSIELRAEGKDAEAFFYMKKCAEAGMPQAMVVISNNYAKGRGTAVDPVQSLEWLEKAAELKEIFACRRLIQKYTEGDGVTEDLDIAYYWAVYASELDPKDSYIKEDLKNLKEKLDIRNKINIPDSAEILLEQGKEHLSILSEKKKAFSMILHAAYLGNPEAMFLASEMLFNGVCGIRSPNEGRRLERESANKGYLPAIKKEYAYAMQTENYEAAALWLNRLFDAEPGPGLIKETIRLLERSDYNERVVYLLKSLNLDPESQNLNDTLDILYKIACKGNIFAAFRIGKYNLDNGEESEGIKWLRIAAESKNALPDACIELAKHCEEKGDTDNAVAWARKAYSLNPKAADVRAVLGSILYRSAKKSEADQKFDEAFQFYDQSASLGNEMALYEAALRHSNEKEEIRDEALILSMLRESAEKNYIPACRELAVQLSCRCQNTEQGAALSEASKWAVKVYEADHDSGLLADIEAKSGFYYSEKGKHEEAFQHYKTASDLGNAYASYAAGMCCLQGNGVGEDSDAAYALIRRSASLGCTHAERKLADYAFSFLSSEELEDKRSWLERAEKRAKECGFPNSAVLCHVSDLTMRGWHGHKTNEELLKETGFDPIKKEVIDLAITYGSRECEPVMIGDASKDLAESIIQQAVADAVKFEREKAVSGFERAAKMGHYKALRYIGECYWYGFGVKRDQNNAVRFFYAASERGDLFSRNIIRLSDGSDYSAFWDMWEFLNGSGDESCLQKMTSQDNGANKTNMGIAGNADRYKMEALLGHSYAFYKLAELYKSNVPLARRLLHESSKRGYIEAEFAMSLLDETSGS